MRAPLLCLFPLLLASCGDEPQPPPEARAKKAEPAPASPPAAAERATVEERRDAAAALRAYYDLIEAGDYRAAWRMRGRGEEGAEAFAKNFAGYERYRVSLGPPSLPVEAAGWEYVEVPIQIFGTMKGGKGFGSVGSVTMRRATTAPGPRGWHIYTG
jgi:hypothetical protein